MKKVLIVGGGSGGTILANKLERRDFEVTLLSASTDHLFQPGLLYAAFRGAHSRLERAERRLLPRHVHFVQDEVTRIDLNARRAWTGGGARYDYDALVVATGCQTATEQIPGLPAANARFGDFHSSPAQAGKVWRALNDFGGGVLAIGQSTPTIKCPPSPLEGMLLAEQFVHEHGLKAKTKLVFFTPYPRAYPGEAINAIVEPILNERGIEVRTFFDVDHLDPEARTIFSIEGEEIHYDTAFVVPPFVGARLEFNPPGVADADRFIVADRATLRIQGFEDAYAIGDANNLPTSKAGVGAHLEAEVVADELRGRARRFDGRTNCPMDLAYGRGTFVVSSYTAPAVKSPPSRLKHWMKMTMARIYWISLRGWLDPIFTWYFALTAPERAH